MPSSKLNEVKMAMGEEAWTRRQIQFGSPGNTSQPGAPRPPPRPYKIYKPKDWLVVISYWRPTPIQATTTTTTTTTITTTTTTTTITTTTTTTTTITTTTTTITTTTTMD
ncbi:hypothetical protein Pmani_016637 [Petrolisthes manimaculis]|uniref:Uncharacterized protein n=1 Tax=Petrolisthes manimaculis TaxID=1843537 RepID=A0AAE1PPB1_9EUCA|nr:hypothetical protein Pmani_016637 [Petrolisthes manimaculis]